MKNILKIIFMATVIVFIQDGIAGVGAHSCSGAVTATAPDERYIDNGDATITDKWTGLMWKQCIEGRSGADCATGTAVTVSWQDALKQAGLVNGAGGFAGHTDWQLPNAKQMASLSEEQCGGPSRNFTIFPDALYQSIYVVDHWTSTPAAAGSGFDDAAYSFHDARSLIGLSDVTTTMHVRLVRKAQ